ncbi:signal peptidase I [Litorivivens sp.]|uniref:signal peptidase I n=1 Tax=Litorivivens sp. TaxID=2020868 RepID=UPI00356525B8
MVNNLLLVVSALTLIVWTVQEVRGRRQLNDALSWCADHKKENNGESLLTQAMPGWWNSTTMFINLAWMAWFASVVLVKDGDFALVLVVITALAGLIALLDRLFFARRRTYLITEGNIAVYLKYTVKADYENLKAQLSEQLPIAENAKSFFPVLLVVLVLRSFVAEPFQIPSASMVPSLEVGDYILVNKFSYGLRLPVAGTKILEVGEPERGDVMVFFPPHDSRYFIKRVVGLPGDEIVYKDKALFINGKPMAQTLLAEVPPLNPRYEVISEDLAGREHLIHHELRVDRGDFREVVRPGHYFMMGDNRDNSSDSRIWGQVPESNIVGKAFAIWMHWRSVSELPSFDRVGTIR